MPHDRVIEIEFRCEDGSRQMARLEPADALALLRVLAARLKEWTEEDGDDAKRE